METIFSTIRNTAAGAREAVRSGSGDGALLYLWLLRHGGDTPLDKARHAFGWDGVRLEAAQAVLTGLMVYLSELHGEYPEHVEVLEAQ